MLKTIPIVVLALIVSSCTRIHFTTAELQPIQSNYADGDLSILILTESTLVSREAQDQQHVREYEFPPRIIVHVSSSHEYKDTPIAITSISLKSESAMELFSSRGIELTLRDSWFKDSEKYNNHVQLKNFGGVKTVRDIYITPWIRGIELEQDYKFVLEYINLKGEPKSIEIQYSAVKEEVKKLVPSKLYWNSV